MSRDLPPLPISENNRTISIKVDGADTLMMARAMLIAANTVMMSGDDNAERRFRYYREQFLSLATPLAHLFNKATDLSSFAIEMDSNPNWSVYRTLDREWSKVGPVTIKCGKATWSTKEEMNAEEVQKLIIMIEEFAPLSCERLDMADVINDRRRGAW